MKKSIMLIAVAATFTFGFAFGALAAKKAGVDASAWRGASPSDAAENLLGIATALAEDGSWENIHVGRLYYLSGEHERGEAFFDRYTQGKVDAGDLIRIARVYAQAGDWAKAEPLFERVVSMKPKDSDWLVEIGAYYNIEGHRERAEALFQRGFEDARRDLNNTLNAAGSYLGLPPRKR